MMPEITETEFKKQIERGTFGSLYLLHGEEKYLLKLYANRLIEKACGDAFQDFNLQRMDGGSVSIDEMAAAVEAVPLLSERKCVAVSDLDVEARSASDLSKLYELIGMVPESTVLVFYLPSVEIDYKKSAKWKKFLAAVQKAGNTVCFKRKAQADAEKMLCAAAAKRHCELSRADAGRSSNIRGTICRRFFTNWKSSAPMSGRERRSPAGRSISWSPKILKPPSLCFPAPFWQGNMTKPIPFWTCSFIRMRSRFPSWQCFPRLTWICSHRVACTEWGKRPGTGKVFRL